MFIDVSMSERPGVTDRNLLFGGASPSYAKATAGRLPRGRVEGRGGDLRLNRPVCKTSTSPPHESSFSGTDPFHGWGVKCNGGFAAGERVEGIDAAFGETGEGFGLEVNLRIPGPTRLRRT